MPDDSQRFLDFCWSQTEWVRQTAESLVTLESPSDNKAAVDRCGTYLTERLEALGAEVTRVPGLTSGDHVRAEWRRGSAGGTGGSPVLLLGHFDTVWDVGTLDRMPLRAQDDRLYGPGIFDM